MRGRVCLINCTVVHHLRVDGQSSRVPNDGNHEENDIDRLRHIHGGGPVGLLDVPFRSERKHAAQLSQRSRPQNHQIRIRPFRHCWISTHDLSLSSGEQIVHPLICYVFLPVDIHVFHRVSFVHSCLHITQERRQGLVGAHWWPDDGGYS